MNFLIIREGGKPLVPSAWGAPGLAQIHRRAPSPSLKLALGSTKGLRARTHFGAGKGLELGSHSPIWLGTGVSPALGDPPALSGPKLPVPLHSDAHRTQASRNSAPQEGRLAPAG